MGPPALMLVIGGKNGVVRYENTIPGTYFDERGAVCKGRRGGADSGDPWPQGPSGGTNIWNTFQKEADLLVGTRL